MAYFNLAVYCLRIFFLQEKAYFGGVIDSKKFQFNCKGGHFFSIIKALAFFLLLLLLFYCF